MHHHRLGTGEVEEVGVASSGLSPLYPHPLHFLRKSCISETPSTQASATPDNIPLTLDPIPEASLGTQTQRRLGAE